MIGNPQAGAEVVGGLDEVRAQPPGLSQEEFSELLRLRGEVGQLRQKVADIETLLMELRP